MNDCGDAAKLRVLTLCTAEGARFRASQKKSSLTKTGMQISTLKFSSAMYCIAIIEAVLSATGNRAKLFRQSTPEQSTLVCVEV